MVLLVRHGKTPTTGTVLPGRAAGLHLSDEGRAQADAVAERITEADRRPVAVYASPLERARETAAPIARSLGLRVRTARGLLECDVGTWAGTRLDALAKTPEWAGVQRWPGAFRFPGGESFAEMSTRSLTAVLQIVDAHRGETVVVVSHADIIKAVVAAVSGVPLDLFQRLVVGPCSVSALAFTATAPFVLCVNSTASLRDLAIS